MLCMERSIGDVVLLRESATNAKQYWAASLIVDAVFECDIGLIEQIATRIDGTVPADVERDKFANLVGDALDDIMDYTNVELLTVQPDDKSIIALAKAVYFISIDHPGKNLNKKKDKHKAVEMVLNRVGGRKTTPKKELILTNYVEPEWMSLPQGETHYEAERPDVDSGPHVS